MPAAMHLPNAPRALGKGEVLADATTGNRFRVTGFIGRGSMGEVYLGEAEASGVRVAIKTIPLALVEDPKVALRTQFESQALRALRHRNVVPVWASGVRQDGVMFMVMEYLQGVTLQELRRRQGRIPIAWSLRIVRDVCNGLVAVHEHAVHRDIKPANLHFGVDARVRILDLGLAKWKRSGMRITSSGTQVGTVPYMSPEMLTGAAPVDVQADIWSVGVVLFELLANRHPFAFEARVFDNPFQVGQRIIQDPHLPLRDVAPLCPGNLARIVDKAMAKNPADLYATAEELSAVLTEAIASFERENGAIPPLEDLAARMFPGFPRRPGPTRPELVPNPMQSTTPLGDAPVRAQPTALPYLRTAAMPRVDEPTPPVERGSEPEPPRFSDVFLKSARIAETAPDFQLPAPTPAPERDALLPPAGPAGATPAPSAPASPHGYRWAAAVVLVVVTAVVLAVVKPWGALLPLLSPRAQDAPAASPADGGNAPSLPSPRKSTR